MERGAGATALFTLAMVAFLFSGQKSAHADTPITITGGSAIVGNTDVYLPITGVEVQGDAGGSVPISLKVDSGTLKLGTTTGLTFTGAQTGKTIAFPAQKPTSMQHWRVFRIGQTSRPV